MTDLPGGDVDLIVRRAMFDRERHDVKINETILWIKNFDIAADRSFRLRKSVPIQASNSFVQPLADRVLAFEAKQFAGRLIQVGDAAVRIGDDDAFLNGVENGFEKSFFLRETDQVILHVLGANPPEAPDQFFKKTRFHFVTLETAVVRMADPLFSLKSEQFRRSV